MQIGGPFADRVQQHLVDETHHGCVVDVGVFPLVGPLVADLQVIQIAQVVAAELRELVVRGLERPLDRLCELVVLDQNGLGIETRMELDLVEPLQVGRVGNPDEQAIVSFEKRDGMVLLDEIVRYLLGDLGIRIEGLEIQEGHAESRRRRRGDVAGGGELVPDEERDERDLLFGGL